MEKFNKQWKQIIKKRVKDNEGSKAVEWMKTEQAEEEQKPNMWKTTTMRVSYSNNKSKLNLLLLESMLAHAWRATS